MEREIPRPGRIAPETKGVASEVAIRISFDLDDMLICSGSRVPREPRLPWYLSLFGGESLRRGARNLMCDLCCGGSELWVYTTTHQAAEQMR
jgi:hypothetical protein